MAIPVKKPVLKPVNEKREEVKNLENQTETAIDPSSSTVNEESQEVVETSTNDSEQIKDQQPSTKIFDLSTGEAPKAKVQAKTTTEAGSMSIINSSSNGKRITVNRKENQWLGNPDKIQFLFLEKHLVMGEFLRKDLISYPLKTQGAKRVVYNAELIAEILERFNIQFDTTKVSKTFYNAEYTNTAEGHPIVVVSMK